MSNIGILDGDLAVWRNRPEESSVIFVRNGQGVKFGHDECSTHFVLPIKDKVDFMAIMKFVGTTFGFIPVAGRLDNTVLFKAPALSESKVLRHNDKIRKLRKGNVMLLRNFKLIAGILLPHHDQQRYFNFAFMLAIMSRKIIRPDFDHPVPTLLVQEV
ncbi:MAG: hypothetical protein WCI36_05350 [bacterium]